MRSRAVLKPLLSAFETKYPGFKNEGLDTRLKLIRLLWEAGLRYRRHNTEEGAFWINYRELERAFGRGGFKEINKRRYWAGSLTAIPMSMRWR